MSNKGLLFVLVILFLAEGLCAQGLSRERTNLGDAILVNFAYSFQWPGGDLADRFGFSNSIGGHLEFLTNKTNFILGLQGSYLFGKNVDEDVISHLRTPEGEFIDRNGVFSSVVLRQRGFHFSAQFGKLFALSKNNPRNGIRATLGVGLFEHKIRVQDDSQSLPQFFGDYKKGYDRLTNGLALTEFIGFQSLSKNRMVNFFIGVEFTQAFTQNRRNWNFDTRSKDEESRLDLLWGVKVGWILPFYFGGSDKFYY